MTKFKITATETYVVTYEVEARDKREARTKYWHLFIDAAANAEFNDCADDITITEVPQGATTDA
jgi:hypothetical protein